MSHGVWLRLGLGFTVDSEKTESRSSSVDLIIHSAVSRDKKIMTQSGPLSYPVVTQDA